LLLFLCLLLRLTLLGQIARLLSRQPGSQKAVALHLKLLRRDGDTALADAKKPSDIHEGADDPALLIRDHFIHRTDFVALRAVDRTADNVLAGHGRDLGARRGSTGFLLLLWLLRLSRGLLLSLLFL
jgi:hypothetical protein